ncbi:hypothetical protein Glove_585g50 [Diversispora epigaea]|uniref:Eukaryotic rRNA processing n=1 Tax=Diversispora epigaea TaxID=1348612 RepID=A0A397GH59_9GLOM|nr:hypothetical protein Glove_585g50 [Diversispora epigaea]
MGSSQRLSIVIYCYIAMETVTETMETMEIESDTDSSDSSVPLLDEPSETEFEINNKSALRKNYDQIKLDVPWVETQSIVSSEPSVIDDINNDVERELTFYKQALEATIEGRKKLMTFGIPFSRPDDYFAEMVKSDEHMSRIRKKLINEEQGIKASEEARRQRELKKFGKKVQVMKIQERQKQKKDELDKIKLMKKKRKGVEDTAVDDDFEIALDEAAAEDNNNRPKKLQKTGHNKKRVMKDTKFGFGGKKRFAKSNTAESSGNISIFGTKNIKKGLKDSNDLKSNTRSKKKIIKSRPGKARRQKERKKK